LYYNTYIMYALRAEILREAARKRGYRGLSEVLRKLGLHRNTLNRYLAGAPILPDSVSKLFIELDVPLENAIVRKDLDSSEPIPDTILALAERLSRLPANGCSVFLFGSRARGTAKRLSDFDLGVFAKEGLEWKNYLRLVAEKEEFEEGSPFKVDVVNLNSADSGFLKNIRADLRLLAGQYSDYLALVKNGTHDRQKQAANSG
jgi:predicted nucleotidyltransferase